jgi:hypothetical protein
MPKVAIGQADKVPLSALPTGYGGATSVQQIFGKPKDLFRVLVHHIGHGETLRIAPHDADCQAFLWRGSLEAGGWPLAQGSSLIVEHGASLEVHGVAETSLLVTFESNDVAALTRAGGHVHILPTERVPRIPNMHKVTGISGALHADSNCPTCELWLHENHFPKEGLDPGHIRETGIHSHTEAEVIFITEGRVQLGQRFFGPGTAIAIAADTFYGFSSSPEGVGFVNFRSLEPKEVIFPGGRKMDETGSWQVQLETKLEYLEPQTSQ